MRFPRRGHRAAALLLALTLTAACAQRSEDDPVIEGAPPDATQPDDADVDTEGPGGFVPGEIAWEECGASDCGTLDVPLDYGDPDGPKLGLFIVRSEATGDREGALFVNPGGPGASGAEYASLMPLILPEEIVEHFDIIGVDPRGVGGSTPIDCGIDPAVLYAADPTVEDAGDRQALLDVSAEYVTDCGEQYGDVLAHVGTADVARDMDAVRAALGDAQLSFLGFSYGSVIGQVYADLFPDRIRSMILDGILELGPTGLELAALQAQGFETALARFAAHCDGNDECSTADDPLGAVEEVMTLAEEPGGIPAPDADRPAGPGEANLGIGHALYSRTLWSSLDTALADALGGDGTALVRLADSYLTLGSWEIYFGVNCIDFAWPTGDPDAFFEAAEAAGESSPHFGEAIVTDYIRCADWPVPPVPLEPVTAPGAPPILVISTTGDPATPYEAGVAVAETLESGVLVTNEGDGHTVVANGKDCIDEIVVDYLVDGEVPDDGTTCD